MTRQGGGGCCGCISMILLFNIVFGGILNDYCFNVFFGIDLPILGDIICGLFLAELLLPCAVVAFVVTSMTDVAVPFWPMEQAEALSRLFA